MKSFSSLVHVGLLAVLLLAVRFSAAAQAPVWQSARTVAVATAASTSNISSVAATAVDAAGNVYLAGRFTNTVMLGGTVLTSLGSNDIFVAKFSPTSSQFVWAQRAGGTGNDLATALAVSGTSVYVAGGFGSSTASFGSVTLANASANANTTDVFVAKLTDLGSTGSFLWAQRAGGMGLDQAYALAVNGISVYVAGNFAGSTGSFGATTLSNSDANTGTYDVFVAKLMDTGNTGSFVWAQRAGGTSYDYITALALNGTSLYVAGSFSSPIASFGTTTLTNTGTFNVFVAKLTDAGSTGNFEWAQRAGGTGLDQAYALAVNGTSLYVAGYFQSLIAGFGSATLTNAGGNTGTADVFVAKLTDAGSTGSFAWAQRAGGIGYESPNALAVSGSSVYVTGHFASLTASFGSAVLTNTSVTTNFSDVFVAKLADAGSTGNFLWAQQAGSLGSDYASAIAVSGTNMYVVGAFDSPTASFGTISLNSPNSNPLGFLASLTDPTLTATTTGRPLISAQLFPNPAHGTATLRLPAGTTPASLTLTDALGRPVRRYPAPVSPEATLDLHGLPAGLYLLRGAGPAQHLVVELE
jgi:hypothetical protein